MPVKRRPVLREIISRIACSQNPGLATGVALLTNRNTIAGFSPPVTRSLRPRSHMDYTDVATVLFRLDPAIPVPTGLRACCTMASSTSGRESSRLRHSNQASGVVYTGVGIQLPPVLPVIYAETVFERSTTGFVLRWDSRSATTARVSCGAGSARQ
jgi:hypothetical protein